jgi:alkanesulfonate monooxygenase SsuD/methylene tetrahydromethanopterin reductase-like flavin-dependent oxidoreductase (luciferase family)
VPSLFQANTPEHLGELGRRIDEAAVAAGRDPADIRRIWNVPAWVDDAGALAEQLATWSAEYNVDTFVLSPLGDDLVGQVERFAGEVAPTVRAEVARTG